MVSMPLFAQSAQPYDAQRSYAVTAPGNAPDWGDENASGNAASSRAKGCACSESTASSTCQSPSPVQGGGVAGVGAFTGNDATATVESRLEELRSLVKAQEVMLEQQQATVDALVSWAHGAREAHELLREEHEVLTGCLLASGVLASEPYLAGLHRRRFARVCAAHPRVSEVSPVEVLRALSLSIGKMSGLGALRQLCSASKCLRDGITDQSARFVGMPRICVMGGCHDGQPTAAVDLFCTEAFTWRPGEPMPTPRQACAAAVLGGRVYVIGGFDGRKPSRAVERFDPNGGVWEVMPPMPTRRQGCAAAGLGRHLYAIGGHNGQNPTSSVERFDPQTCYWEVAEPMPTRRSYCAAVVLGPHIYVLGGTGNGEFIDAVERFDPKDSQWEALPRMPVPLAGCTATAVGGALYLLGGFRGSEPTGAVQRFDTELMSWDATPPPAMPTQRYAFGCAYSRGRLYIVGGHNGEDPLDVVDSLQVDDGRGGVPCDAAWETLSPLASQRTWAAVVAALF